MQKKGQDPDDAGEEILPVSSENVIENKKFIKKLELQRVVLNKIVSSTSDISGIDINDNLEILDSKTLLKNN